MLFTGQVGPNYATCYACIWPSIVACFTLNFQVTEPDEVATWAEQEEADQEHTFAEAAERRRKAKKSKCTVS